MTTYYITFPIVIQEPASNGQGLTAYDENIHLTVEATSRQEALRKLDALLQEAIDGQRSKLRGIYGV